MDVTPAMNLLETGHGEVIRRTSCYFNDQPLQRRNTPLRVFCGSAPLSTVPNLSPLVEHWSLSNKHMKTWKSERAIYVHATLPLSLLSCGPPTSPKLILRKWHDALVCKMPCETASVYWCLIEKDNEWLGKGITRGEVVIKTIIKCLFPRGRILSVVVNFSAPSSPNSLTIPMGPYFLK